MPSRRSVLRSLGAGSVLVGGCLGSDDGPPPEADVVVGPDSRLVFEPETLTVAAGDTVTWYFASPSHNVSCLPEDGDTVELPDSAATFASHDGNPNAVDPQGSTYEHTVETPGEYRYVCVPHAPKMAGRLRVE
jgi:plastocyanin